MFTGLIEAIGDVAEVTPTPQGFRLRVSTTLAAELTPGDSLAVNGVCLTVVAADAEGLIADISPETARVTTLGALERGDRVNLERPLQRRRPARRPLRPGARRRGRRHRRDPRRTAIHTGCR